MAVDAATRRLVLRRAEGRCEYCRLPAEAVNSALQIEHVRARKHRGSDGEFNLASACILCNLHKGSDLTGIDPQTDEIAPLFNPRRMVWAEHFEAVDGGIVGLTPEGRTTAELLQLNETRRLLLRMIWADMGLWP